MLYCSPTLCFRIKKRQVHFYIKKKIIKKGVLGAAISSNVATGGAAAFAYITNPVFF